ncbi:MAG: hypothetical protein Q7S58_15520 [Candidatus Binatus sp.]|uniref:hypothetical protein n=1 Tax=Candidatus Binatus sp. TaxID=2811406 RepID=UPI00272237C0|nr:hypothetical protein [Candidatus Binatus sp.]MDO8433810.1 hypothetical protein [Candidatus Binatus sp.]
MSTTNSSKAFYQPILPSDQIQFREYKLLLKPELFPDQHAFHKFWKLAHHAVKPLGVKLSKMDADVKPQQREVVFYDTPHNKLYNSGFILRKRTFYHHGAADPHHELVLKFRHPDKNVALAVDPRPLLPCKYTMKFKEEILLPRDGALGMRLVYSHNCELDTPNIILTQRFETTADAFPALKSIGANPKAALGVVNGLTIQEYQVDIGILEFGKLAAKATLSVWRVQATDEPIVAEFGYQLKFDSPEAVRRKHRELSEFFYTGLQARASDWVQRGTTKTALVYGFGNSSLKHQE